MNKKIDKLQGLFDRRKELQNELAEVDGSILHEMGGEIASDDQTVEKKKKKSKGGNKVCEECGEEHEKLTKGRWCLRCYQRLYARKKRDAIKSIEAGGASGVGKYEFICHSCKKFFKTNLEIEETMCPYCQESDSSKFGERSHD